MAILVKKFGGSSVATPEKIHGIVNRVLKEKQPGDKIVIVVSAMGDSTDDLLALAGRVNPEMPKRELDMLLATGEQVTIALMAGAFWAKGQPAVSFTGAQAGIKTNDKYSKASIINVEAERVQEALDEGNVVIVAGFQGITGSGDITTLGRGGSDTTAVAIAAGLNAGICDIYTDVDGVYTADPRIVPNALKLDEITFAEMLELAKNGYNNIICAQPFGCLPNHIAGRGMLNKIKGIAENANILPIDYDSSASKVNQENRIKLMLATAE